MFLSSHILSEVEALCDRVGILRDGRLVDEGTLDELRHLSAQTVEVTFDGPAPDLDGAARACRSRARARTRCAARSSGERRPLLAALADQPVVALTSREPSLEEIFLHHYDRVRRCAAASAIARRALADSPRPHALVRAPLRPDRARADGRLPPHATRRVADRLQFARSFGDNKAIRLFYGVPHDLLTVGGYVAWRVGGILSIFAAGVGAARRRARAARRGGRRAARSSSWPARSRARGASARRSRRSPRAAPALARHLGRPARRRAGRRRLGATSRSRRSSPVARSSPASARSPASSRRRAALALELGGGVLARRASLLRVVADTSACARLAALGDAARLGRGDAAVRRPAAGGAALPLLRGAGAAAVASAADRAAPRRRHRAAGQPATAPRRDLRLLSSPTALALRERARPACSAGWSASASSRVVVGVLPTPSPPRTSRGRLRDQLHKLGGASITTPAGSARLLLPASSSSRSASSPARRSRPRATRKPSSASRRCSRCRSAAARWLAGRLVLAAARRPRRSRCSPRSSPGPAAASQGAGVSPRRLLEAGANCLPSRAALPRPLGRSPSPSSRAPTRRHRLRSRLASRSLGAVRRAARRARVDARPLALPATSAPSPPSRFKVVDAACDGRGSAPAPRAAALRVFGRRDVLGA